MTDQPQTPEERSGIGDPASTAGVGLLARGPWPPFQVETEWSGGAYDPGPEATAAADEAIAELGRRGSPTHDGWAARLSGFREEEDRLLLELQPARWALRLSGHPIDSLSALCVVRDSEGRWLAGRRAEWVANWAGRWALGAGGAVERDEDPVLTLSRELQEEWSVAPRTLSIEALVRVPHGSVFLVGLATLPEGAEVVRDAEHDEHAWWPPDPGEWPEEADDPLRLMGRLLSGRSAADR